MVVGNLTLMDWAKRHDPSGKTAAIAMLLSQTNEILTDATYVESNQPTSHVVTVATGLPSVNYRALNQGVTTAKGQTSQITEPLSILETRSEVDIDLAMLNGNTAAFRLSEARMFIEAMNQKMATELFYANPATDSKAFRGLAPRYNGLSGNNSQNIINAGGTIAAKQTSVWLVCWSPETVFCVFPKGSKAGLLHDDLGRQTSYDTGTTGERMEVFADRYQWKTGLAVKDWRYAVRICNLEVEGGNSNDVNRLQGVHAPSAGSAVVTNLLHRMAQAIGRIPQSGMGRCAFYLNRTVFTSLMRLALESGVNSGLMIQTAATEFGTPQRMLSFLGFPIRQCDALLNTESVVS